MILTVKYGWVIDDNNNRANISKWGSEEKARESLMTLKDCTDCTDCYDCYDCASCTGCTDCIGCYDCADCTGCHGCTGRTSVSEDSSVPVISDIHKKVYQAVSVPGALDMGDWHTCDTTHCRAGWVVHLAGQAGYDLERKTDTGFAAMKIYRASGYNINPARFYDSADDAMADMKRLAEAAE